MVDGRNPGDASSGVFFKTHNKAHLARTLLRIVNKEKGLSSSRDVVVMPAATPVLPGCRASTIPVASPIVIRKSRKEEASDRKRCQRVGSSMASNLSGRVLYMRI